MYSPLVVYALSCTLSRVQKPQISLALQSRLEHTQQDVKGAVYGGPLGASLGFVFAAGGVLLFGKSEDN